jgi:hypothetical protein
MGNQPYWAGEMRIVEAGAPPFSLRNPVIPPEAEVESAVS